MTAFKAIGPAFGVLVLRCVVLARRSVSVEAMYFQPIDIDRAADDDAGMAPNASAFVQASVAAGDECAGKDFTSCAREAGCEWLSVTGTCTDGCQHRQNAYDCAHQYDRACKWRTGEGCKRTAQCKEEDFRIAGTSLHINMLTGEHGMQARCQAWGLSSNRCACWHGSSVPALRDLELTTVCKLCKECAAAPGPYPSYDDFEKACIAPAREEKERLQKDMEQAQRDRAYQRGFDAFRSKIKGI